MVGARKAESDVGHVMLWAMTAAAFEALDDIRAVKPRDGTEEGYVSALFSADNWRKGIAVGETDRVVLCGFPRGGGRPASGRHDRYPGWK